VKLIRIGTRILVLAVLAAAIYFFAPAAGEFFRAQTSSLSPDQKVATSKIRRTQPLTTAELKIAITKMRLRSPKHQTPISTKSTELMTLGKRFFFDQKFSANGQVSCATCHQPEKSFTDGRTTAVGLATTSMNTPTLVNSYFGQWFFWNGRSDSLEAQALGPVENPKEHGFTRVNVAKLIASNYKKDYEALFGKLPSNLPASLPGSPTAQLPAPTSSPVSNEVAAYALATLGNQNFLKKILRTAQSQFKQPVEILRRESAGATSPPTPFDQLTETQKSEVNMIFANFGRAVAEFERSIESTDSPFDLFIDRVSEPAAKNKPLRYSFGAGFDAAELRGLELFTGRGNCTLCHQGAHFTDQQFHNIGLMPVFDDQVDLGRAQGMLIARDSEFNCRGKYLRQAAPTEGCLELQYLETESAEAVGAFKTPTLRNLRDTGPYGHDGRFPKLIDILHHYNHLKMPPAVGHTEEMLVPLDFTEIELHDLELLLMSMSGSVKFFKGG
jgi:cytochrome c peroxidase